MVKINDKWLAYALEQELGKPLTEEKLAGLTHFTWDEYRAEAGLIFKAIHDLSGIELCKNVKALSLDGNCIEDLTPLKELTRLEEIWLVNNSIKTLTGIENLHKLKTLCLDLNYELTDISGLTNLKSLEYVHLGSSHVTNLSPLLTIPSLSKVSIYNIKIDVKNNKEQRGVLVDLLNRGVEIGYDKEIVKELSLEAVGDMKGKEPALLTDFLKAYGGAKIAKIVEAVGINGVLFEQYNWYTPLSAALSEEIGVVLTDQYKVVKRLLKEGAKGEIEITYSNGCKETFNLLNRYLKHNYKADENIARCLFKASMKVTPGVFNGLCEKGFLDMIQTIVKKHGYDINTADSKNLQKTPLHCAVEGNQGRVVQFLIREGADLDARAYREGTPLHYALNLELVQMLIEAGADINALDADGKNHLFLMVTRNDLEVIRYLLLKGIHINQKDNKGRTALFYIEKINNDLEKQQEIVSLLIQSGADPAMKDNKGRTIKNIIKSRKLLNYINSFGG